MRDLYHDVGARGALIITLSKIVCALLGCDNAEHVSAYYVERYCRRCGRVGAIRPLRMEERHPDVDYRNPDPQGYVS